MKNKSRKKIKKKINKTIKKSINKTIKKTIKNTIKNYVGGNYVNIRQLIKPDYSKENENFKKFKLITSFIPLSTSYMSGLKLITKSIALYGLYIDNFYRLGQHNVLNNILPNKVCSDLLTDYMCNTKIKDLIKNDNKKGETLPDELKQIQYGGGTCEKSFCHSENKFNNVSFEKGSSIVKKTMKTLDNYNLYKTSDEHYKFMNLLYKYTISELVALLSVYNFVNTKYNNYEIETPQNMYKEKQVIEEKEKQAPKSEDYVNLIGPFKKINDINPYDYDNIQELLLELLNLMDACMNLNYYGIYPNSLQNDNQKEEFQKLCSIKCQNCTLHSQSKIPTPESNNADTILSHIFYLMYNHYNFKKYKMKKEDIIRNIHNIDNNVYNNINERQNFDKNSIPFFMKELKLQYPDKSYGITEALQQKIKDYFDSINLPLYTCKMILYKVYTKKQF